MSETTPINKTISKQYHHLSADNEARFLMKVERTAGGCWKWLSGVNSKGYGQFSIVNESFPPGDKRRYKNVRAHKWSYERFVGQIPDGLILRHLCHDPGCVRPEHLEVGTAKDNMHDSYLAGRLAGQSNTHCKYGHEYTEENTYWDPRGSGDKPRDAYRKCRTCRAARKKCMDLAKAEYMFFTKDKT